MGRSAGHDRSAYPRTRDGLDDQPMAVVSESQLSDLGAFRILSTQWRVRFPGSIAGCHGLLARVSRAGAGAYPARGESSVRGRRRAALVAPSGRRRYPFAHFRRPPVAAPRRRTLCPGDRRCGHPARGDPVSQRSRAGRGSARQRVCAGRHPRTRHVVRTLPASGRSRHDVRAQRPAPDGDGRLERRDEPGRCRGQGGERLARVVPRGCARGDGRVVGPARSAGYGPDLPKGREGVDPACRANGMGRGMVHPGDLRRRHATRLIGE